MATQTGHRRKAARRPARPGTGSAAARPRTPGSAIVAGAPGMPLPAGLELTAAPGMPSPAAPVALRRAGVAAPAGVATPARPVPPGTGDSAAAAARHEVLRPVVTATCWVDPGEHGAQYEAAIRFTGRRTGVTGKPGPGDRFERMETVRLLPGSGPVAVTTRVEDVNAGEWLVWGRLAGSRGPGRGIDPGSLAAGPRWRRPMRLLWGKGNPVAPAGGEKLARTRIAVLATAPGIITASWAGLVAVGLAVALAVLVVLLGRVGVGAGGALAVALAASLAGAASARGWYVMLERGKVSGLPVRGLCIQGFLAGAVLAGIPGLLLAGIPVGTFFDAAAPGLFFAMAIGRQGCFLTGCCVGRLTASRWGVWSSDGRIGARRIPAQQLESLVCLLVGTAALAMFLRLGSGASGAIFTGAMAVYILARQGLLALRADPRRWALAAPVTLAVAAAALLADALLAALR